MPRALGVFRKAGIDTAPWPTDYRSEYKGGFWPTPNPGKQLIKTQILLKEWLGLVVYRLLGRG